MNFRLKDKSNDFMSIVINEYSLPQTLFQQKVSFIDTWSTFFAMSLFYGTTKNLDEAVGISCLTWLLVINLFFDKVYNDYGITFNAFGKWFNVRKSISYIVDSITNNEMYL